MRPTSATATLFMAAFPESSPASHLDHQQRQRELLPEETTAKNGTIGLHGGKELDYSATSRMIECSRRLVARDRQGSCTSERASVHAKMPSHAKRGINAIGTRVKRTCHGKATWNSHHRIPDELFATDVQHKNGIHAPRIQ